MISPPKLYRILHGFAKWLEGDDTGRDRFRAKVVRRTPTAFPPN
jgi:hypothetical protein